MNYLYLSLGLQVYLLRINIHEVESVIQAGLGRITWQSLKINEYCRKCNHVSCHVRVN